MQCWALCDNLSRYFLTISFSLLFYRIKCFPFIIDLSVQRYFCKKSAIINNKIQQVIVKKFTLDVCMHSNNFTCFYFTTLVPQKTNFTTLVPQKTNFTTLVPQKTLTSQYSCSHRHHLHQSSSSHFNVRRPQPTIIRLLGFYNL